MSNRHSDIERSLKEFILAEFLPGEPEENLRDSTPLISGAIMDSIGVMKLVLFIDQKFGVEIEPEEMGEEHLGSIVAIAETVNNKLAENRETT